MSLATAGRDRMVADRARPHRGPARWRRTALTGMATLLVVTPFLWMLSLAFKPPTEVFTYPPRLLPQQPTLDNFVYVWETTNIPVALTNSLVVSFLTVLVNCLVATAAGYAFARVDFGGSKLLFILVLGSAMVPAVVQLIPLFLVTRHFPLAGGNDILGQGGTGLLDTHAGLLLPLLVQPLNVFLARQYFLDMPDELADAARVDGAGELRIFWRIYLPLGKPIVATIAVLSFTGAWEDFLWPLVVVSSPDMQTLPLALSSFAASGVVQYGPLMASTVIAIVPALLIFLAGQRHFVHGLGSGGVKG
ncbi:carbohydrate ABC transporter permease [Jiangella aurantiaca]|uniref:Carbohydrate ABC transporter permease n=1 Tax=Jiangella aurantiaca TaxID=2530373 RepID=A0A4R5ADV8_9ACTN|nr:carbohydrate ABC transporter permease [Jiangella aurantiaca]TDD70653.1 carbohydrate ABC transporter permease [Jiangella aurantiaca]